MLKFTLHGRDEMARGPVLSWILAATRTVGGADAHAGARGRGALFDSLLDTSDAMTAFYDDSRDDAQGDHARPGREYPSSTRAFIPNPTEEKPGAITVGAQNRILHLSSPGVVL